MQEKLKKLNENTLIELSTFSGFRTPYVEKIIITKDKMVHTYQNYLRNIPKEFEGIIKEKEGIFSKKLSNNAYEKVINYIESNIIGKEFDYKHMRDAKYDIFGNYKEKFYIHNNADMYNDLHKIIKGR